MKYTDKNMVDQRSSRCDQKQSDARKDEAQNAQDRKDKYSHVKESGSYVNRAVLGGSAKP